MPHVKADYAKALMLPVLGWIFVDAIFILVLYIKGTEWLAADPTPAVVLTFAFGAWAGSNMVRRGGRILDVLAAGLVVGAVCAVGSVIETYLHNPVAPTTAENLANVASSMALNLFGAVVGGGYLLSQRDAQLG